MEGYRVEDFYLTNIFTREAVLLECKESNRAKERHLATIARLKSKERKLSENWSLYNDLTHEILSGNSNTIYEIAVDHVMEQVRDSERKIKRLTEENKILEAQLEDLQNVLREIEKRR
ncbi:hypothetical protein IGI67_005109 [Enterococcus sp. AZ196]